VIDAKGKIVLFYPEWKGYGSVVKYRGAGASMAAKHGAVAALVRSATNVSLATPHTGMMRYAEDIPEIPAAAVTVEDAARMARLAARGTTVKVRLMMEARNHEDREQPNVMGELRGRELPDQVVVVGGHLDSWDVGTGAHDDGAGCAITLGAARLLHALELRPRRTIRVVLFNGEEQGGYGGRAYKETHADELDRHVAALESDSGGFAPNGFSVRADEAVGLGGAVVEGEGAEGGEELLERGAGLVGPRALRDAILQLADGDRRHPEVARGVLLNSLQNTGWVALDEVDARVGIEHVPHHSGSRCSCSPWSGRPSGRKSSANSSRLSRRSAQGSSLG
jgi:hypothetical protein